MSNGTKVMFESLVASLVKCLPSVMEQERCLRCACPRLESGFSPLGTALEAPIVLSLKPVVVCDAWLSGAVVRSMEHRGRLTLRKRIRGLRLGNLLFRDEAFGGVGASNMKQAH